MIIQVGDKFRKITEITVLDEITNTEMIFNKIEWEYTIAQLSANIADAEAIRAKAALRKANLNAIKDEIQSTINN